MSRFEMCVSAPRVLFKESQEGTSIVKLEPVEEVTVDVDAEHSGIVIDKLSTRGGELLQFKEIQVRCYYMFSLVKRETRKCDFLLFEKYVMRIVVVCSFS
jgi:predicted membrane GTPase involved in stress response